MGGLSGSDARQAPEIRVTVERGRSTNPVSILVEPASPSATDTPRLELRDVGCRFGPVRALDGVSFRLPPGEIVALLGDSGCGKSTLLRVVAGLERPDRGGILLDGRPVDASMPPEARGIGMMFQDYALFPHLTVAQNVRFGLSALSRSAAARIAAGRLDQVGLGHRAESYPGTLSGGEAQRVALARALAPGPRVLLLDEPFSNLDRRNRDRVRADTIAVLRASGATALIVTHDPEEALSSCDRIVLMRSGAVVQVGTGEDLYRHPVSPFAARFFGETIEVAGRCVGGGLATPFGILPAPHPDGTPLLACLRPEGLRIGPSGHGAPGRVLERRYLGAQARITVAVDGMTTPLGLIVAPGEPYAPGDTIGLSLRQEIASLFVDDGT